MDMNKRLHCNKSQKLGVINDAKNFEPKEKHSSFLWDLKFHVGSSQAIGVEFVDASQECISEGIFPNVFAWLLNCNNPVVHTTSQ